MGSGLGLKYYALGPEWLGVIYEVYAIALLARSIVGLIGFQPQ